MRSATLNVLLLVLATLTASEARAQVREARLAVIVGADEGEDGDTPLRYAERDATRVRDLLTELGDVASARAILVRARGPADLREALREATGRAAELRDAGYRITFLFYYSGHGDEDSLHLPGGRLALNELRRIVAAVPAEVRLSILDACRGMGRQKGVSRGAEFALSATQRGPRGNVELRASSDGEAAQESDELRGSVFTHFMISGMRGNADDDGDRRVTLAELYAYTYRRTLLRTQTGPGVQHASLDVDLEGSGELVVAVPGTASATLFVPKGEQRYLIIATPSAAVMGELTGDGAGFALPVGRYLVIAREGTSTRAAEIDASRGGNVRLSASDFHEVRREQLVARGGWLELRRARLRLGVGSEVATDGPERPTARVRVDYARLHGPLWWEVGVGGNVGRLEGDVMVGHAQGISSRALLGWRWRSSRIELGVGAGPELRYARQHAERRNVEQYSAFDTSVTFAYGAAGMSALARLDFGLGANSAVALQVDAFAGARREAATLERDARLAALVLFSPSAAYVLSF